MNKAKKITIWALSFVMVIALGLGGFFLTIKTKPSITPDNVAEVKDTVTDENGNNLMDGEYHPLPARMLFTPAPLAASAPKTFIVNLAVTVTPTTAAAKPLDWAVDFVNADSEWASGKTVTDYVTVTPTVDGAKTVTVTCLKAFGEQIRITVTARENPNATAMCLLDYKQQLLSYDLSVAQAGKSPTVNVSRKSGKLVADVESDNEINFGYSYSKSDVYTVALNDSEVAKPTEMSLSYKSALSSAMNKVKENAAGEPIATATENGFKVAGYLNKNAVNGLSIENHNKIIAAINSNYYSSTIVTLNDADGNTLVKYTFDTDTSLIKKQGIMIPLSDSYRTEDEHSKISITYQEVFNMQSKAFDWLLEHKEALEKNNYINFVEACFRNADVQPIEITKEETSKLLSDINDSSDDEIKGNIYAIAKREIFRLKKSGNDKYQKLIELFESFSDGISLSDEYYKYRYILTNDRFPIDCDLGDDSNNLYNRELQYRKNKQKEVLTLLLKKFGDGIIILYD